MGSFICYKVYIVAGSLDQGIKYILSGYLCNKITQVISNTIYSIDSKNQVTYYTYNT